MIYDFANITKLKNECEKFFSVTEVNITMFNEITFKIKTPWAPLVVIGYGTPRLYIFGKHNMKSLRHSSNIGVINLIRECYFNNCLKCM